MPRYEMQVTETRTYMVRYVVQARDVREAEEKANFGDMVESQDLRFDGVIDRQVVDKPCRLPERKTKPKRVK